MNRRAFLRKTAVGTVGLVAWGQAHAADRTTRPNIVLIMCDDIGYEAVGAYGSTLKTPSLDRAAGRGMRFNHCYAQPLCTPSRVKIMTGRFNHRNYKAFGYLDSKETTFANLLKTAGYATCVAGKWQLCGDAKTIADFGFDRHCLWNMISYKKGPGIRSVTEPPNARNRFKDPVLYRDGKWIRPGAEAYGPDVCCSFIESFIAANSKSPFLVYYPMILVHSPFVATPDSPDWKTAKTTPKAAGKKKGKAKGRPKQGSAHRHFAEMVAYTDKIIGRIEAALRNAGVLDNTVLMFLGDNGTHKSLTTPLRDGRTIKGGKGDTTDAGTRVPFIAWGRDVLKGKVTDALVDCADFMPTLLDYAGVTPPRTLQLDGKSLRPVFDGRQEDVHDSIFCYYNPMWGARKTPKIFARTQTHKLYADGRLYHVATDPLEKTDLAQGTLTAEQAAIRKVLKARMDAALGQSGPNC